MIYGFYFRFLKATHNKALSIFLSKLAYFAYLCKFQWQRLTRKKVISAMSVEEAHRILNETYPDPHGRPEYTNPAINPELDLSIVVPVYDYANLIRANIESILNQKTQYSYELILVDDGSTDGARDIVLEYQNNPKVKVILEQNRGIAGARNNGVDHASGKYLMFIDCDDTVHDNLVQVLLDRAYAEDCDIAMCAHNLSKERDGQVYSVIPNIYPEKNLMGYRNHDEIMNYAGLPWCKVYKRELWNNVRFFPGYWYEDTIIQFLLFTQCKKFSYVPEVEYEYRWYENNFSHVQGKATNVKAAGCYWLLRAILEQYQNLALPVDGELYALLLRHLSAYYYKNVQYLNDQLIEAVLVLANELLSEYKGASQYKLPYILHITEKAILNKDINLWKLASCYQ